MKPSSDMEAWAITFPIPVPSFHWLALPGLCVSVGPFVKSVFWSAVVEEPHRLLADLAATRV